MTKTEEPVIKPNAAGLDFTCVTFYPDLKRFKIAGLDEDTVSLFTKRAYDMAGVTDSRVKVYINGKRIEVKNFCDYCDLYLKNEENRELPKIIEQKHERWEVVASLSDGQFQQVSFVNSISTIKGGTHVNYVTEQIVSKVQAALNKKSKKLVLKPH